ncbi:MAG TPA: DUF393 domain-containing protein [Fermentimonas sp.]|nr:DUF393 domain-containing protein [Fermentimonas sp.]
MTDKGEFILLYDGDCSFCNRWVQWVVDRDKGRAFRFAAIESDFSKELHRYLNIDINTDSISLIKTGDLIRGQKNVRILSKSKAVSYLFMNLDQSAFLYKVLKVTPRIISDFAYDCIAALRRYLPVRDCRLYNSEERDLFLNEVDFVQFIS